MLSTAAEILASSQRYAVVHRLVSRSTSAPPSAPTSGNPKSMVLFFRKWSELTLASPVSATVPRLICQMWSAPCAPM